MFDLSGMTALVTGASGGNRLRDRARVGGARGTAGGFGLQ
jgi:hypothetical protein